MKTYVIGNLKGGTGKTTTAVNLAYAFAALYGKKVLVVDMDPQCNMTSVFTKANRIGSTVYRVLTDPEKIADATVRTKYKNIDVIKGDPSLTEGAGFDPESLYDALLSVEGKYDACVIDTRPAFENLTKAALYAADTLLVPVCLDKFCRDNLALVEESLLEMPFTVRWYALANKVDCRRKTQRTVYADLLGRHAYPFLNTCVGNSAAIDNALAMSKPVMKHRASSAAARDYAELAAEITGKEA